MTFSDAMGAVEFFIFFMSFVSYLGCCEAEHIQTFERQNCNVQRSAIGILPTSTEVSAEINELVFWLSINHLRLSTDIYYISCVCSTDVRLSL